MSLLRSLVADAESSVLPYHTIVEVYRVAPHMPLMRVLPSAADEVNAALFHPFKASPQSFFFILLSYAALSHCSGQQSTWRTPWELWHCCDWRLGVCSDQNIALQGSRCSWTALRILAETLMLTMLHCAGRWHCIWHQGGEAAGFEALSQRCTWVAEPHHGQPGQLSQPCR